MNGKNEVLPTISTVSRATWSSIFAGTIIVIIIQATLMMLGIAIGLGSINPFQPNPAAGLGTGAIIWWVVVSIIALFIGGWVSGRLAGIQRSLDGALHGLVTWGLATLLAIYLLTSAVGAIIGGAFGLIGNAAQFSTQAYSALPPSTKQQLQQQGQQLQQQGQQQLQQQQQQLQQMTPEQKQQMEQEAKKKAQEAAATASKAATGAFFMLLLGGIAAGVGGAVGRVNGPVKV